MPWIPQTIKEILTTKGDLAARSSTTVGRLAVGSDGQVLKADSTDPLGVAWANESAGGAAAFSEFMLIGA